MGSKKIIVPQGLINPNETTIIEIPSGIDSEATLIARSSPSEYPAGSRSKTLSKSQSKTVPLMITKVTSTTVFADGNEEEGEDAATPAKSRDYSAARTMYRSAQSGPYQEQSRPITPKSSRYQDSYQEQQSSGYESYAANQCVPNKRVCDNPTCPVVSSMLEARKSAASRNYSSNSTGVPQSFTNDPRYYSPNQSGYQSPRPRIKKITRKVVTETPSYSTQPPRMAYQTTSRFNPVMSSTARSYEDNPEPTQSCTKPSGQTQTNLKTQVERHLAEIEESERQKINRDLAIFQQARRRLVEDATTISSGESNMQFGKN